MAATFLIAGLILFMIYRLEEPVFAGSPGTRLATIFLSSMLIFSPAMYEAWLWGLEIICFVPLACLLAGLLITRLEIRRGLQFPGCILLAVVSTYSFGNGFLNWIFLGLALFFPKTHGPSAKASGRRFGAQLGLWIFCFAAGEILYFYNYQRPVQHYSLRSLIGGCFADPGRTARFFFGFFGAPLVLEAGEPLPWAVCAGAILIVLSLAIVIWIYRLRNNPSTFARAWPWLAIGGQAILSAGLATVTRSAQFGAAEALSSRYGIFAVALIVSLVHLIPILAFDEQARRGASAKREQMVREGLGVAAVGLAIIHCFAFPAGVWDMRSTWQYRLMGKGWLAFIHVIPQQRAITELLYPNYDGLKRTAMALSKLGLLQPPPFTECPTNLFQVSAASTDESHGRLEASRWDAQRRLIFTGWAVSDSRLREADAVVLTYERANGQPYPFSLSDERVRRQDLALLSGNEPYYHAGWQAAYDPANLPKDLLVIRAWRYDTERQTVSLLAGAETVDNR
jgi:hypothetical protein